MVERAGVCRYVCVGGRYAKKKSGKKNREKDLVMIRGPSVSG